MNDDVFDFFYEAMPGYEEVGNRRIMLGCWSAFQNPDVVRLQVREHGRVGPRASSLRPASSSTASS